jgi:hypothetical protein
MVRYGDYFSRKELFYLGVNPNQELDILNNNYNVEDKYEKVNKVMKEVYDYLKNTNNQKFRGKSLQIREEILNNKVQRRIVAAFYDLGILNEKDLNKIPLDYKINASNKESIIVNEALDQVDEVKESFVENKNTKERVL